METQDKEKKYKDKNIKDEGLELEFIEEAAASEFNIDEFDDEYSDDYIDEYDDIYDELAEDDLDDYELDDSELIDDADELEDYDSRIYDMKEKQKKSSNKTRQNSKSKINKNSKQYKKKKVKFIGTCMSVFLIIVLAAAFIVKRYMPSTEKMSGYEYFKVNNVKDSVLLIVDNNVINNSGKIADNRVYLSKEDIHNQINKRFYFDAETNGILYTDASANETFIFMPDTLGYSDAIGNIYSTDYEIVKIIDGNIYIDFEFAAQHTMCDYSYGEEPKRVSIHTEKEEETYVTTKKKTAVRYRAGRKSDILENVAAETKLYYTKDIDKDWIEVRTTSGYKGYVKSSDVTEPVTQVPQYAYQEQNSVINKDHKINMGWFQTTSIASNTSVDNYIANAQGMNTISPTWYSITDASGNVSSIASADFVKNMHAKGLEVWPLINDFEKNIDYNALYSSKTARSKLINRLIFDSLNNGYDGLNVDFENITAENADSYLQFIRELSVQCQNNNIVLSIDNYKPAGFNSFYNLKEQAVFADYIIIMGYDEHYAGSKTAGSVASLPFVEDGITGALDSVPASQLINAIPFYTRIWTVSDAGVTSKAVGMQAAMDEMNQSGADWRWDEETSQYYCSYIKDGATVKIWFEEEKSITSKMQLYSKYGLAGAAEWKLGFEIPDIWNVIADGLKY